MPRNDMGPDDLYRYVASIAKRRQLKFDELAGKMQMSKTTLWRYMKGMNAFTPDLEKRLCEALEINEGEADELRRLISINLVDSSLVAARYSVDKFMFSDSSSPLRPTELDFMYYRDKSFARKSSDIIREIISFTEKPDCESDAWVINCSDGVILENITYLLGSLIPSSEKGSIEQLVTLPDKNFRKNIMFFLSMLPLLRVKGYTMRYMRVNTPEQSTLFRKSMLLIRINYSQDGEKKRQYYFLTFSTNDMSQCICFEDDMMFAFLMANYVNHSHNFSFNMPERANVAPFSPFILDFESSGEYAMIKRDPSYCVIPLEAYQSLAARMNEDEIAAAAKSVDPNCQDPEKKFKEVLQNLKKRNKATYSHRSILVYSRLGLEDFARTGKLRDAHISIPAFSRREMRRILECLKNRIIDENDPTDIYITYKDFLFSGQVLCAAKNVGTLIDIGVTKRLKGMNCNLFIKDEQLTNTLYDYAANHIPDYHALDNREAIKFIDSLIAKYAQ